MDEIQREERRWSKEFISEVPKKTGVYLFEGPMKQDAEPSVLYVGKAKNLHSRVSHYFVGEGDGRPFVQFIRKKCENIRTIVVATEQEALLLENELIKKYRPPYNISLRDDKRYLSLRLDLKHEWPRVEIVRKIKRDKAIYLGPFSSASKLRSTLDFMQKVFPLRTCNDHKLYNRSRPCIEYEIKRCVAPCVNYVTKEDYQGLVQGAVLFLKGKNEELVKNLETQMHAEAEAERFERAAALRDQIEAISRVTDAQGVISMQQFRQGADQDAIGFSEKDGSVCVVLVFIRNGIVFDQRKFDFKSKLDPATLVGEFIQRYYSKEVYIPKEVLVPFEIPEEFCESLETQVSVPRSGDRKKFLELAQENARVFLDAKMHKLQRLEKTLTTLQKALDLKTYPRVMDCMDISHHQGSETVASVVRFRDGSPDKDGYRRIKMKVDQVDDFESMREAVERRYKEEADLPNLIVIDGGRGQLSSAEQVLSQKAWLEKVDLVSLAKARDRDGLDPLNPQNRERIFKVNQKNPILLKENSAEELLLRYLRDEAHRFAITYHRLRKERSLSISLLDEVEGMTERIKLKLLRRFGSVEGVRAANDVEILQEIPQKMLARLRLTLEGASNELKTEP